MFFRRKSPAEEAAGMPVGEEELPSIPVSPPPEMPAGLPPLPRMPAPLPQPTPAQMVGEHAPLFVKVEKYREILSTVGEMKGFSGVIKQINSVISEAEGVKADALRQLNVTLARLERSIAALDAELLRPVGLESFPRGEVEIRHIEDSLTKLGGQVASLRRELETFKG